jgi:hypothetical protein
MPLNKTPPEPSLHELLKPIKRGQLATKMFGLLLDIGRDAK